MAIVEAASCGLQVVSTRVGGIPEVLPPNLIHLTDVTVDSLYKGLLIAIEKIKIERNSSNQSVRNDIQLHHHRARNISSQRVLCPYECNEILRSLYNWNDVTQRTERVYETVLKEKDPPFGDKLSCYMNACIPFVLVVSFSYLFLYLLDIIEPRKYIDLTVPLRNSTTTIKKKNYHYLERNKNV